MKKQILHISVHQSSKVIAAMHTAMMTGLFLLPTILGYFYQGRILAGIAFLLIVPFFIWLFMYIGYVIACWFYNLVVPWTGGIEIKIIDVDLPVEQIKETTSERIISPNKIDQL